MLRTGIQETRKRFEQLANTALDRLRWADLSPQDIQTLFRSPANPSYLTKCALQEFKSMRHVGAQVSLLHAVAMACPDGDLSDYIGILSRRIEDTGSVQTIASLESALRRGPVALQGEQKLLVKVQSRMFDVTLDSLYVWNQTPSRGHIEYLERCIKRGRDAWEAPTGRVAIAKAAEVPKIARSSRASEVMKSLEDENAKPQSNVKGVTWHQGLSCWEVRIEVGGHSRLAGYFRPEEHTSEGIERACFMAVQRRQALEQAYYQRGEI